jgi:hypothetical protein
MDKASKQMRRVVMPTHHVVNHVQRNAPEEFVSPLLREVHADARTGRVIFHIETSTDVVKDAAGRPRPMDHEVDWESLFGGKANAQVKELADFILAQFPDEIGEGEGAVDVAIKLLRRLKVP